MKTRKKDILGNVLLIIAIILIFAVVITSLAINQYPLNTDEIVRYSLYISYGKFISFVLLALSLVIKKIK